MELIETINLEDASTEEAERYSVRKSVRAVLRNTEGNVALISIGNGAYFKLPGGGVENSEDNIAALKRECLEEIGSDIKDIHNLGYIVELKKSQEIRQESYVYTGLVTGELQEQRLTESEIRQDFKIVWPSLSEAVAMVEEAGFSDPQGEYVFRREMAILNKAISHYERGI